MSIGYLQQLLSLISKLLIFQKPQIFEKSFKDTTNEKLEEGENQVKSM
jgi:hypothetical protein